MTDDARVPPGHTVHSLSGRGLYVVGLLLIVNIVNFVDRQLPFILIDAIKAELRLTDSEIGLMAGLSFAIVYSLATLLLAHIADRWSSRWVLTLALAVWSVMTALSGLAANFIQLVLCRMGVAASEAGCTPSAHSLISRLIVADRRALALAVFSLGVPIGSMLGLSLGGWINDVWTWRTAFFVVGLPGLAIALLSWWSIPSLPPSRAVDVAPTPFLTTLRHLFAMRSFRHMATASSFYACGSYAINVFAAAFLMRVHGLSASQAGLCMGIVFGVGGLIGTFAGGVLGDSLGRRSPAWRQRIPAVGQWLSLPTALAAWLVPNVTASVMFLTISYMFGLFYFAPTFAAAQSLVRDEIRATTSAALLFCLTLIGSSVGPMVVGWLSDRLAPQWGHLSLRYAMCASVVTIALSAIFFHLAGRALADDLRARMSA